MVVVGLLHSRSSSLVRYGSVSCHVAVNHIVELTEEEKAEARQEAIKQYQREELAKLQSRNARVKKTENVATQVQPSLFDF